MLFSNSSKLCLNPFSKSNKTIHLDSNKTSSSFQSYDEDELVDYYEQEKKPFKRSRKLSKSSLTKQLAKIVTKSQSIRLEDSNTSFNYRLEYTDKGKIKRPTYYNDSTDETYYMPITMDVIRSVILKQHCKITKEEEIIWFEDGLKWLSQQQYQQNDMKQYRYYIEEDTVTTENQIEWEDLERSCEAYFGIPLALCENHWAAEYLANQASKGKLLKRVALQPSLHSLKKLWCF